MAITLTTYQKYPHFPRTNCPLCGTSNLVTKVVPILCKKCELSFDPRIIYLREYLNYRWLYHKHGAENDKAKS